MDIAGLPKFFRVKRSLQGLPPIDAGAAIDSEWDRLALDVAGKRIAIGVGSRGITDLQAMVRRLVDRVRSSGGFPFIV
ncbi:hypothetical protein ACQJZ3_18865, partial [Bacillus pumilus]